ncbi:xylulokinase [Neobacillus niacini]|uniref:xylulokinase n=1 Tax=Neobacillus niacini TaxID=86668 RepID=UPI003002B2E0
MGYVGIDVGTSGVKIVYIERAGRISHQVTKEYPLYHPEQGWSEQHPEDWWEATSEGFKELLTLISPDAIKGIGLSGQMHGLVVLDENGDVLTPAILWNDQRTYEECSFLNDEIGKEFLTQHTGNIALTGFTAPKILWLKKNKPEIFEKARYMMLPKDYIGYKLTGSMFTDVSDASGTLYFDVKNRTWSKEMLEILGIRKEMLPTVYESFEIAGTVNEIASVKIGVPVGVRVVAGAGDNAAGAVGSGIIREGTSLVSLGTSGVVYSPKKSFSVDKNNSLHTFCDASGKWHVMGVMLSAASSLKWWVEDVNQSDYDTLLREAENTKAGSKGLYFLPYLSGERTPHHDPYAKGTFVGLNSSHSRGDMTRAILEGVAFALNDSVQILKKLNISFEQAMVIGGGTKSPLWMQILADVFHVQIITHSNTGGPALGAAILAAVGDGAYPSIQIACEQLDITNHVYMPIEHHAIIYKKMFPVYQNIYSSLRDVFEDIYLVEDSL